MMRKVYITIIMLAICACTYATNWFGVSPTVFTTLQLDDSPLTTPKLGAGGGLGINYLMQKQHFILQIGAEATYNHSRVSVEDSHLSYLMKYSEKWDSVVYSGLLDQRCDASYTMAIRIPVMLGAEYEYLYFLAGAKLHLNLSGKAHSSAFLTTKGEILHLIGIVENAPLLGFDEKSINNTSNISYSIDLRPSIEVGAVLYNRQRDNKMHLGLFAEYGLLNSLPRERHAELLDVDMSQYMQLNMNHIYTTRLVSRLNQMTIGIRFTTYLEMREGRYCKCVY